MKIETILKLRIEKSIAQGDTEELIKFIKDNIKYLAKIDKEKLLVAAVKWIGDRKVVVNCLGLEEAIAKENPIKWAGESPETELKNLKQEQSKLDVAIKKLEDEIIGEKK